MADKLMGAAAVIVNSEGRVLLVRHSYGKLNWDLPGGKSEKGESAAETAIREVSEETGLSVSITSMTGVYYDPDHDMHHFAFIATSDDDRLPEPSSPEILECRYCEPENLPTPISDFTCGRIQDALGRSAGAAFRVIGPRRWIE